MPGAGRIRGTTDGGPLRGGAPRVVWQTLGADPRSVSATTAAGHLNELDRGCHLVWNPLQGETVQLIPILRAGRLLGWPEHLKPDAGADRAGTDRAGTDPAEGAAAADMPAMDMPAMDMPAMDMPAVDMPAADMADSDAPDEVAVANAEGRLCVQICVVAFAWDPFTALPLFGLRPILDWLGSWGIPGTWPAGPPPAYPDGTQMLRSCADRRLWARGGHFGASQVPGLTAAGPGAVDIERLTGHRVPVPRAEGQAVPEPAQDLDGYFGRDEAAVAGALSRVG
jgi:hypothetical protein